MLDIAAKPKFKFKILKENVMQNNLDIEKMVLLEKLPEDFEYNLTQTYSFLRYLTTAERDKNV